MHTCHECDETFDEEEGRNRHLKSHRMTFEAYMLKWKYGGVRPTCACGCGGLPRWNVASRDYVNFVHGHHAFGRKKSEDEKRRIGEKNSVNMTRYMKEHPEVAQARSNKLNASRTPEIEQHRIQATKDAYASMSSDDKQKFSDHSKQLWVREDGLMQEAAKRAGQTFTQRYEAGEYDFTERNDKISKKIAENIVNGRWNYVMGKGTKGYYQSTKTGENCYYRSTWELDYMKMLDQDDDVVTWESEFTWIPYEFEGVKHRYLPDFHVVRSNDRHQLVEIKPQILYDDPKHGPKLCAKRAVAKEFCEKNGWEYVEWSP